MEIYEQMLGRFNETIAATRWRHMLIVAIYEVLRDTRADRRVLGKAHPEGERIAAHNAEFFKNLLNISDQIVEILTLLQDAKKELNQYKDYDLAIKEARGPWQIFFRDMLDRLRPGPAHSLITAHRGRFVRRLLALLDPQIEHDHRMRAEVGLKRLLLELSDDLNNVRSLADASGNAVIIELFEFAEKFLVEFETAQSEKGATKHGKFAGLLRRMQTAHDELLPRIRKTLIVLREHARAHVPRDKEGKLIAHPDDIAVSAGATLALSLRRREEEARLIAAAEAAREADRRRVEEAERAAAENNRRAEAAERAREEDRRRAEEAERAREEDRRRAEEDRRRAEEDRRRAEVAEAALRAVQEEFAAMKARYESASNVTAAQVRPGAAIGDSGDESAAAGAASMAVSALGAEAPTQPASLGFGLLSRLGQRAAPPPAVAGGAGAAATPEEEAASEVRPELGR